MKRFIVLILLSSPLAFAQRGTITKIVSTASGSPGLAPNSLATIYGTNLADRTEVALGTPFPGQLAGITVVVNGSNISMGAPLIYASPTQINFVVPAVMPVGTVDVEVVGPETVFAKGTAEVQSVAPALLSADGTGAGVAAAIGIRRVLPLGLQSFIPVFTCDPNPTACRAIPMDVGVDAPLLLEFFGTGIRGGKDVTVTIGGKPVPVLYAGPQPQLPGLDQVNVSSLLSLRGAGIVDVVVTVDGQSSNAVQVSFQ